MEWMDESSSRSYSTVSILNENVKNENESSSVGRKMPKIKNPAGNGTFWKGTTK